MPAQKLSALLPLSFHCPICLDFPLSYLSCFFSKHVNFSRDDDIKVLLDLAFHDIFSFLLLFSHAVCVVSDLVQSSASPLCII